MGDYLDTILITVNDFKIPEDKWLKFMLELDVSSGYFDFDRHAPNIADDDWNFSLGVFSVLFNRTAQVIDDVYIDIYKFDPTWSMCEQMRVGSLTPIMKVFAKYGADLRAFATWDSGLQNYIFIVKDGIVRYAEMDENDLEQAVFDYAEKNVKMETL